MRLVHLVEIQVPGGTTRRYATKEHVNSGTRYEQRLLEMPTITFSIAEPTSGVVEADSGQILLANGDGQLNAWLNDDNEDPRGGVCIVSEHDLDVGGGLTEIFRGQVIDCRNEDSGNGERVVTLSVVAQTTDTLNSRVPFDNTSNNLTVYNQAWCEAFGVPVPKDIAISSVAYTTGLPYAITTATPHGFSTNDPIFVYDVTGNTAANGKHVATVTGPTTLKCKNTSSGVTNSGSGGYVRWQTAEESITPSGAPGGRDAAVAESLGAVFPVVFGATREHIRSVYVQRDPYARTGVEGDGVFAWIAGHDLKNLKCRTSVNTVYLPSSEGGVQVLPEAQYTEDHAIFPGYCAITRNSPVMASAASTFVDAEATEWDSMQPGTVRHWLFRNRLTSEPVPGRPVAISTASNDNAMPIVVTTSSPHGMLTGQRVTIAGVATNTNANGTFTITVTGDSTFTLDSSGGNGAGTGTGGTATADVSTGDTNALLLSTVSGAVLKADYKFASAGTWLNDSSPSGYTLTTTAGSATVATNVVVAEPGYDYAINNAYNPNNTTYFASYFKTTIAAAATFAYTHASEWHVRARVRRSNPGFANITDLSGSACGKYVNFGWALSFDHGAPVATLVGSPVTASVTTSRTCVGNTDCGDGQWHEVIMSVARTTQVATRSGETAGHRLQLFVDGRLEGDIDISVFDSTYSFAETISGLQTQLGIACAGVSGTPSNTANVGAALSPFVGQLGRVIVANFPYQSNAAFVNGQSDQGLSAVTLASGTTTLSESNPTILDIGATAEFAVMAWFRRTSTPSAAESIARRRTSPNVGFDLSMGTDGRVTITLEETAGAGGTSVTKTSTNVLSDGAWHQVWATLNRTTAELALYVDGAIDGAAVSTSAVGAITGTDNFTIDFKGDIDEIAILVGTGSTSATLNVVSGPANTLDATAIKAQYHAATGNPARLIRSVLSDTTWGLGLTTDATTFDSAAATLATKKIKFSGALTSEREARAVLNDMVSLYGMLVKPSGSTWKLDFSWASSTTYAFGKGQGTPANILDLTSYQRRPLDRKPRKLTVAFHRINDATRDDPYTTRTKYRTVGTRGVSIRRIDADWIRDWPSADRIAKFHQQYEMADRYGELTAGLDNRAIRPGDKLTLAVPAEGITTATTFRARHVVLSRTGLTVEFYQDAPNATTYTVGVDDTDPVRVRLPDATPDLRFTSPESPFDFYLSANVATPVYSRFQVRFTMPSDELSKAIITGARIMWSYADDVDDEPDPEEGGRTAEIKASGGETLTYGSFVDPGRVVIVKVHSIGRNGKASTNAFPAPNSDYITNATGIITNLAAAEVRFTSAIDANPAVVQPQSQAGFNARINALETGPASAIARPRVLAGTYNGSATVFTDQLPSVPDLAYDCVIFLSNELLIRDVSTPPAAGKFYLSTVGGATNRTVTYYRAPISGEIAVAIYV